MKQLIMFLLLMLTGPFVYAASQADVADHPSCKFCGMDRDKFAHSRMLIEYDDGTLVPICSLHCAAIDLASSLSHAPVIINVADFPSHNLVNAQDANWVVGGNLPGVMSARGKWAFADRSQAEKFVAEAGGTLVNFENAVRAAFEDMYQDTLMIRERRKARMMNKP